MSDLEKPDAPAIESERYNSFVVTSAEGRAGSMSEDELLGRIKHLENRQKGNCRLAILAAITVAIVLALQWRQIWTAQHPQRLRVRELAVVDEHGVERVLIAAPLPDPMIAGKRHNRGGAVSGIVIADATGTERGGYATGDAYANAVLTLDGQGFQTVLLLAEPDGSTMFRIWNGDKGSVTMGVEDNPFLNVKQNGKPLFLAPADNPESKDARPLFR
jgi:hypothetical protein